MSEDSCWTIQNYFIMLLIYMWCNLNCMTMNRNANVKYIIKRNSFFFLVKMLLTLGEPYQEPKHSEN